MGNNWEALSAIPEAEQCGWLKDKYGVSWQIIPRRLGELMSDTDPEKSGRVMEAMLQMKKIEIDKLEGCISSRLSALDQWFSLDRGSLVPIETRRGDEILGNVGFDRFHKMKLVYIDLGEVR